MDGDVVASRRPVSLGAEADAIVGSFLLSSGQLPATMLRWKDAFLDSPLKADLLGVGLLQAGAPDTTPPPSSDGKPQEPEVTLENPDP